MNNLYLKFIDKTVEINIPCDLTAQRLLEWITVRDEKPPTVMNTMNCGIASPATIHRKIDDLLALGLVELTLKPGNRRTKYIVPTKNAHAHFKKLGAVMFQIVKEAA